MRWHVISCGLLASLSPVLAKPQEEYEPFDYNFVPEYQESDNDYYEIIEVDDEAAARLKADSDVTVDVLDKDIAQKLLKEDQASRFNRVLGTDLVDVEEEVALEEFFEGIEGDAMMLQVISDMNGLESFLDSRNATVGLPGLRTGSGSFEDEERGYDGMDERTLAAQDSLGGLKRFAEFKQLVSWLQPVDKRITRYCFYGCWCLPEGAHGFVAGTGRPIDLVDRSCQQLWFCYVCAGLEFKGVFKGKLRVCNPTKRRYLFKFRYDRFHPKDYSKRDIICRDPWVYPMTDVVDQKRTCARAICECDRGGAFRLGRFWRHWDKSRHRIWSVSVKNCAANAHCSSDFDVDSEEWNDCRSLPDNSCLFITGQRCVFGEPGGNPVDHEEVCCGLYQDEGRRYPQRDHGGQFACCSHADGAGFEDGLPWNGNWFNQLTHCCVDGRPLAAADGDC